MQTKSRQMLCWILTVFMLISGMCLDNVEADSLFVCTSAERSVSYLSPLKAKIYDAESCTIEMLGVRTISYIHNMIQRLGSRTDIKISLISVIAAGISQFFSNFHIAVNTVQLPKLYSHAAVLCYIHNQDGKK